MTDPAVWDALLAEFGGAERGRLLWTDRTGRHCYERYDGDTSTLTLTGAGREDLVVELVGVDPEVLR